MEAPRVRRVAVSGESMSTNVLTGARKIVPKAPETSEWLRGAIARHALFAHLDGGQLAEVVEAMAEQKVSEGVDLITQGQEGDFFYVVQRGLFAFLVNGLEKGTAGEGACFGELALLYNCPRAATVVARQDSAVWRVDRVTFRKILMSSTTEKRRTYESFLEDVPILAPLTQYERFRLADMLESVEYSDGELILEQGQEGDAFFIMEEGEAVVYKTPAASDERVELKRLERGSYFGEMALLTNKPRAANVESDGPSRVLRLETDAFVRLLGPCEELLKDNLQNYKRMYETFLEDVPLLASLTGHERQRVAQALQCQSFADGEYVLRQGDTGDMFYLVESGEAEAELDRNGESVVVKHYTKGDYFGELSLLNSEPRAASVRAKGALSLAALPRSDFVELLGPAEEIIKRNTNHYKAYQHLVSQQPAVSHKRLRRRRQSISAPQMLPSDARPGKSRKLVPKSPDQQARIKQVVARNIFLAHLDPEQQRECMLAMEERQVAAGDAVVEEGQHGDNFYVVSEGKFLVFVAKAGAEPVATVEAGGSFGELALMYNCPRAATVRAETDGVLWSLDQDTFRRILTDSTARNRALYEKFLEQVPILAPLEQYERYRVADALERMTFKDSELIISEGETGDAFFIVEDGEAVVYKNPPVGENPTELKRLFPGDYFGEIALLTDKPRAANVIAYGPTKLLRLSRDSFVRLLGPCEDLLRSNIQNYKRMYETFLDEVTLLSTLTKAEKKKIAAALTTVEIKDGDCIIRQGDIGDMFYIIVEGNAIATRSPGPGIPAGDLGVSYTKGDYFGEVALLTNKPRRANIIAVGDVKCVTLDRKRFVQLLGPIDNILKRNMGSYAIYEGNLARKLQEKVDSDDDLGIPSPSSPSSGTARKMSHSLGMPVEVDLTGASGPGSANGGGGSDSVPPDLRLTVSSPRSRTRLCVIL